MGEIRIKVICQHCQRVTGVPKESEDMIREGERERAAKMIERDCCLCDSCREYLASKVRGT